MSERVKTEIAGGVAHVTLTRGDKHNGMDMAMLDAVAKAAQRLRREKNVRAVILQGDGPSFCAGLDFKSVFGSAKAAATGLAALWSPVRNRFQDWSMAWREVPAPARGAIVREIGETFRRDKDLLGRLVSTETGKILSEGHTGREDLRDGGQVGPDSGHGRRGAAARAHPRRPRQGAGDDGPHHLWHGRAHPRFGNSPQCRTARARRRPGHGTGNPLS